jgi:WD repeat-containing protein mio
MRFETSQSHELMSPLLLDKALADIPLFGDVKADINVVVRKALQASLTKDDCIQDVEACHAPLPDLFVAGRSTAEKLRGLRAYSKDFLKDTAADDMSKQRHPGSVQSKDDTGDDFIGQPGPPSNRELHEQLLSLTQKTKGFPKDAQMLLDHIALLRAKDKYLFDVVANRNIVSDDPWLRDLWDWIAGTDLFSLSGD